MTDSSRDDEAWERVRQALSGRHQELTEVASKVLRLMLDSDRGCDASIHRDRFQIVFGQNSSRHSYFMDTAPAVVSQLMRWAGVRGPTRRLRALLDPREVPTVGVYPPWRLEARGVWLESTDEEVLIRVRDASGWKGTDASALPEAIPELVRRRPSLRQYPEPRTCPRCGVASQTFKQFDPGASLACPSCGGSFPSWT